MKSVVGVELEPARTGEGSVNACQGGMAMLVAPREQTPLEMQFCQVQIV
jgi:hypothetical protein